MATPPKTPRKRQVQKVSNDHLIGMNVKTDRALGPVIRGTIIAVEVDGFVTIRSEDGQLHSYVLADLEWCDADLFLKFLEPASSPLYGSPVRSRAESIAAKIETRFALKTTMTQNGISWEVHPAGKIIVERRLEIIRFGQVEGFRLTGARLR